MKFITILQIYVFGTIESTANLIVVYFLPSFLLILLMQFSKLLLHYQKKLVQLDSLLTLFWASKQNGIHANRNDLYKIQKYLNS